MRLMEVNPIRMAWPLMNLQARCQLGLKIGSCEGDEVLDD
jgi:hypothetical protein